MLAKNIVVISLGMAALALGGCVGCGDQMDYPGYCDTTGCYACSGPNQCWPVSHGACGTDAECAAGERCTDIGCTPACTSDADCVDGEVCDGTTDLCAPAGVSPKPIDPTQLNPNPDPIEVPESCTTDEECQKADPALVCDNGTCIDACTSDDDCAEGYVCAPCGKCTPEDTPTCGDARTYCDVNDASSCGAERACLTGHCHLTCDPGSSCPIGQICQAGVCVDDPSPQSPQCLYNADCTAAGQDAVCVNGYCHPTCTEDAGCGFAELCNVGVCMPDYRPAQ
jgi:hypothetical protein